MTLLASADFNDRLVQRSAPVPQEPDRAVSAAEAKDLRASAAFSHFTETCGDAPTSQQAKTAPEHAPACSGAVILSEASRFILSLIAAHEGRCERDVLAKVIAEAGEVIGISGADLARRRRHWRYRRPAGLRPQGGQPIPERRTMSASCCGPP